jgi:hypothetical protein
MKSSLYALFSLLLLALGKYRCPWLFPKLKIEKFLSLKKSLIYFKNQFKRERQTLAQTLVVPA